MRKLAGVLLIVCVPLSAFLGAMYLVSSASQSLSADVQSDDLSKVSADLVSPEELAKMRAAASKRRAKTGAQKIATRHLFLACLLIAAALLELVSGIAALIGRAPRLVLALIGLSALTALLAVVLDRPSAMMLVLLGLLLGAGGISFAARSTEKT